MYNTKIIDIKNLQEAENAIRKIGSDPHSIPIMAPKAILKVIKLEKVVLQDAIIVKQDMLSVGGEVAVPKNTFELHEKTGDILIIGNLAQLKHLVSKLKRHYPRLKKIADEIEKTIKEIK